jgi:transposase
MGPFALSTRERTGLEELAAQTDQARVLRRAQALLWLDEAEPVQEVAERAGVARQTLYNWATRFHCRSALDVAARVADAPRSGRPRTAYEIIDPLLAVVIARDPRELGYRSTVWTAPMLVQYLSEAHHLRVSRDSVRLAIVRLQIRWKRPRYQLARRLPTWRQAKGGSNGGYSQSRARCC